jgi:hypothetical protein
MKTTDNHTEKDPFIRIIRDKLSDYSIAVEKESWNQLETALKAQHKGKIRLLHWISGISIAASLALFFLFLYPTRESSETVADRPNPWEKPAAPAPVFQEPPSPPLASLPTRWPTPWPAPQEQPDESLPAAPEEAITIPETEEIATDQPSEPGPAVQNLALQEEDPFEQPAPKPRKKPWGFGVRISSAGQRDLYASASVLTPPSGYSQAPPASSFGVKAPPLLSSDILSPDDFGKVSHSAPISVGISFRKTLTNRLSLESGVIYTYLHSLFENKSPRRDASMALHYVGIPVDLVFDLLPRNHGPWNIYFSTGGTVEKGLLAHYVQNTYATGNNVAVNTTLSDEKIAGLQWSIQLSLGLSYQIHPKYSLFLEPKLNYYLKNNQPFNIRTESPFAPGINLGIRHTW